MNEQEFTRRETFLKKIAGYSVDKLPEPLTREEVYLKKIAENGIGGSGGADLSDYAKKADVATAIESAHTHTNKDFLDGIEAYLNSTYSKVTAEREAADNNLATRIKALEDSVGDISTALAVMVEV